MTYVSDIIKIGVSKGFAPVCLPGKKLVMVFSCPKCKQPKMVKFMRVPDKRHKYHACVCGHRHWSPGWEKGDGTFNHIITEVSNAKA